jgi:hypothetical protein
MRKPTRQDATPGPPEGLPSSPPAPGRTPSGVTIRIHSLRQDAAANDEDQS